MDIKTLTSFFMWCSIINGGLLLFWTIAHLVIPDLVYRSQKKFFHLPKETFTAIFYSFIGLFKILFLVFNLVPYLALLIIG
jgi:hypothetical protein